MGVVRMASPNYNGAHLCKEFSRNWCKLHLAIDKHHQISCELTGPEVGDPTAMPNLLT